jgi:hypothetical protein
MEKPHWVMDYETINNLFVAVFQHYKTEETKVFVVHESKNDFPEYITFLQKCVTENQWHISYNGLSFDAQITQKLLLNQKSLLKLSAQELVDYIYKYAQTVIEKSNKGDFAEFAPYKLKIKQIDLFKLNHWDNKAKMSGLKWIQYSMDWENVEEMPHRHDQPVTDSNTLNAVIDYCINVSKNNPHRKISKEGDFYSVDVYPQNVITQRLFRKYMLGNNFLNKFKMINQVIDFQYKKILKPKKKIRPEIQVVHYPRGGGYFDEHKHERYPSNYGIIITLSKKGRDFDQGVTSIKYNNKYINLEKNNIISECSNYNK